MARYTGPRCKKCRRQGEKLFLKGEKCFTDRCVLPRRTTTQPVRRRGKKLSAYSLQLREKQKVRTIYGLSERQFRLSFERADRRGNPADNLLILLERRLDNVVFRLGFANSRNEARQLIRHGHIQVSGHKVDVPSYLVRPNQMVGARKTKPVTAALENRDPTSVVPWMVLDRDNAQGRILRLPANEDTKSIPCTPQLIVELYSK